MVFVFSLITLFSQASRKTVARTVQNRFSTKIIQPPFSIVCVPPCPSFSPSHYRLRATGNQCEKGWEGNFKRIWDYVSTIADVKARSLDKPRVKCARFLNVKKNWQSERASERDRMSCRQWRSHR